MLARKPGTAGCISETGTGAACTDGAGLDGAVSVIVSSDGENAYVASIYTVGGLPMGAVAVFDRDLAGGALTQKPGAGACVMGAGFPGECTAVTALSAASSISISPDGRNLYAASQVSDAVAIFDRDESGGALTQKPGLAGCISGQRAEGSVRGVGGARRSA